MDTTQEGAMTPESCEGPFGGAQLAFPITFDLRVIYILEEGASIESDLKGIYERLGVECGLMQGIAKPNAKYGRFGSRVTVNNREQFYSIYDEIGKLPYVKAAI